jgi:hypothetical protein
MSPTDEQVEVINVQIRALDRRISILTAQNPYTAKAELDAAVAEKRLLEAQASELRNSEQRAAG